MGRSFDDDDIERLLAGDVSYDDPELGAAAMLVDELRHRIGSVPAATRTEHLRGMRRTHGERVSYRPERTLFSSWWTRLIAVIAAASIVFASSMAIGGTLPRPVQRVVAQMLDKVGFELPSSPSSFARPFVVIRPS